MHIEIQLTATILVQDMHLIALGPVGIVQVEVVVEAVEANVLQVVGQTVFIVHVAIEVRVVRLEHHIVDIVELLDVMEAVHLVVLSHLEGLAVKEAPGMNLILSREHNALHIVAEQAGNGEGIDEELLVHMLAGPEDDMLEGLPVFGVEEETHQTNGIFLMQVVHDGPHVIVAERMMLPELKEMLQLLSLMVVADMFPRLVFIEAGIVLRHEDIILIDMLQHLEDELLLHQEILVSHLGLDMLALAAKRQER